MPSNRNPVLGAIEDALKHPQAGAWMDGAMAVAYSGGLDSTVLLHALASLKLPVSPVHVNHQLQAVALQWETHCSAVCESMGVPLKVLRIDVPPGHQGVEGQARQGRYRAIQTWMTAEHMRVLACGHHLDDQIETVLLQLFRGSGLRGLAGMRMWGPSGVDRTEFPNIVLFRPFLELSKSDLLAYANAFKLTFVEDPSNSDTAYKRNWIRQSLLPELKLHFPQAMLGVRKMSTHFQDHFAQLDLQNEGSLAAVCEGDCLLLKPFGELPDDRQAEVLRAWLQIGGVACNRAQLLELQRQLGLPQGGRRQVCNGWYIQVLRHKARLLIENQP